MTNAELKKYGLRSTDKTLHASEISGEKVFEVIGFDDVMISTYDVVRDKSLPDNIWCVSKATPDGIYQIHLNQGMLETSRKSAKWAAEALMLQIYLKEELDEVS